MHVRDGIYLTYIRVGWLKCFINRLSHRLSQGMSFETYIHQLSLQIDLSVSLVLIVCVYIFYIYFFFRFTLIFIAVKDHGRTIRGYIFKWLLLLFLRLRHSNNFLNRYSQTVIIWFSDWLVLFKQLRINLRLFKPIVIVIITCIPCFLILLFPCITLLYGGS